MDFMAEFGLLDADALVQPPEGVDEHRPSAVEERHEVGRQHGITHGHRRPHDVGLVERELPFETRRSDAHHRKRIGVDTQGSPQNVRITPEGVSATYRG